MAETCERVGSAKARIGVCLSTMATTADACTYSVPERLELMAISGTAVACASAGAQADSVTSSPNASHVLGRWETAVMTISAFLGL